MSANFPCKGGIIAPPNIIITKKEEPWDVYFPKPWILKAKIEGHIIEQKRPPLKKANKAILPVVNNPTSIATIPKSPKILSVKAGLSLPAKNPTIWMPTQSVNQNNVEISNPEIKLTNKTTPNAT